MKRRAPFHVLCLLLLAFSILQPDPAYAQEQPPSEEELLALIPDEYIDEAIAFQEECGRKPQMFQYQDCECLASKFLDKRIELGPYEDRTAIALAVNRECTDATEAAGYVYTQCLGSAPIMPPEIPIEEFCTCYANTYAELFETFSPAPGARVFVALQTRAMVTCRDPALARKLYPPIAK